MLSKIFAILSSRHRRGRCKRIVNDAPTIDSNVSARNENKKTILETKAFEKKVKIMCNERNCIKNFCDFL